MYCPNCGTALPEGTNVCAACGQAYLPSRPKKRSHFWRNFLILLLIMSVVGGTAAGIYYFTRPKEPPKSNEELIHICIDRFEESYNNGDLKGVIACLSAKRQKQIKSIINLMNAVSFGIGCGPINISSAIDLYDLFGLSVGSVSDEELLRVETHSISFTDAGGADVCADISFQFAYGTQEVGTVILKMVKEKGKWYIDNMIPYEEGES